MLHLIQNIDFFSDPHYYNLIETVIKLNLPYQIVKFENHNLVYEPTNDNNVFCWGSVKFAQLAKNNNWQPGSFLNENHDFRVYSKYYEENLLNFDSQILDINESFEINEKVFHVRPCEDNKFFTGQIFTQESWNAFKTYKLQNFKGNVSIQVSKIKEINKEIRFFIIDGKPITASEYRINNKIQYLENNDSILYDFVSEMCKLFQPAKAFVMDVAETPFGPKIIEINCLNSAGFYLINMEKLILEIERVFG